MNALPPLVFVGQTIAPGTRHDLELAVTQSYAGLPETIPVTVWRGRDAGPTVFVSGAVHGDELNGTGIVRELMLRPPFDLHAGTLVLIPVINVLGFQRHSRYLPDRRDLNRSFPGTADGSLASRLAHRVMNEIIRKCDYGIDLHTAAIRRTNFPNVRADLTNPEVCRLAIAFGSELVVNGRGPKGTLRRAACRAGCPTIILEAGEVWKIEPSVVEFGVRGVHNVLIELGMASGKRVEPGYRAYIHQTKWVRADWGGILEFHVGPGDIVEEGQPLATNVNLRGHEHNVQHSPLAGIVLGMTTLPAVTPGEPICHLAIPRDGIDSIRRKVRRLSGRSLHERLRDDLATNVAVSDPDPDPRPQEAE